MKKKIAALCMAVVVVALSVTVMSAGADEKYDVTKVAIDTYAAKAGTTSIGGLVSEKLDSFTGAGDIIGDVSDIAGDLGNLGGDLFGDLGGSLGDLGGSLGDILGGLGGNKGTTGSAQKPTGSVTYSVNDNTVGYITPVPYASELSSATQAEDKSNVNETVDFAASANPYTKPTAELKGGDTGDGVKWIQWMFIYTRYGLKDDGITGVYDEDTVATVKKLQSQLGLEVDGVADSEVIAQIELLYFQAKHGVQLTAASTVASDSKASTATDKENKNEGDSKLGGGMLALIIGVAVVWVVAIGFVVALFIIKKKKKSGKDPSSDSEASASEQTAE